MLARMGVALEPNTRSIPSEKLARLKELHLARQALIKDRTAAKNREKILQLLLLKKHNARAIAPIGRQLFVIENEMEVLVTQDQHMAERLTILASIPGIPRLRLHAPDRDARTWPDRGQTGRQPGRPRPIARQSGRWTGRAFIRGGRANLRQAL
jgi:transposase